MGLILWASAGLASVAGFQQMEMGEVGLAVGLLVLAVVAGPVAHMAVRERPKDPPV